MTLNFSDRQQMSRRALGAGPGGSVLVSLWARSVTRNPRVGQTCRDAVVKMGSYSMELRLLLGVSGTLPGVR